MASVVACRFCPRRWEVVGGGEKGGLLVRDGPSTTAAQPLGNNC